jgi:hypothetical protein
VLVKLELPLCLGGWVGIGLETLVVMYVATLFGVGEGGSSIEMKSGTLVTVMFGLVMVRALRVLIRGLVGGLVGGLGATSTPYMEMLGELAVLDGGLVILGGALVVVVLMNDGLWDLVRAVGILLVVVGVMDGDPLGVPFGLGNFGKGEALRVGDESP